MDVAYTDSDNVDLQFPDIHLNWMWEQEFAEYQSLSPSNERSVSKSEESQRLASSMRGSTTRARTIPKDETSKRNSVSDHHLGECEFGHNFTGALSLSGTEFATANLSHLDAGVMGDNDLEFEKLQHTKIGGSAMSYDDSIVSGLSNIRSFCPYPGCTKSFGRKYEAQRHYNSIHSPVKAFLCTYPHCSRLTGFARKDKWMAHERIHRKHGGRSAQQ